MFKDKNGNYNKFQCAIFGLIGLIIIIIGIVYISENITVPEFRVPVIPTTTTPVITPTQSYDNYNDTLTFYENHSVSSNISFNTTSYYTYTPNTTNTTWSNPPQTYIIGGGGGGGTGVSITGSVNSGGGSGGGSMYNNFSSSSVK